jgi:hypothetical protein
MIDQEPSKFNLFSAGETFFRDDNSDDQITSELVFLGVAPGIIRIGYRESSNGIVRHAASLDLTFHSSDHFYFTVMKWRFEVNRADNDGLSIRPFLNTP